MRFDEDRPRKRSSDNFHNIVRLVIIVLVLPALVVTGFLFFRELGKIKAPTDSTAVGQRETDPDPDDTTWIQVSPTPAPESRSDSDTPSAETPVEPEPVPVPVSPEEAMREVMVGLKDVVDGAPLEPKPFHWLLGRASVAYGTIDLLEGRSPDTLVADLRARPADFRGKKVKLTGLVKRMSTAPVGENPYGIVSVQSGVLFVGGSDLISLFIPRTRPAYRAGDLVRVYGFFFKIERYTDRSGGQSTAPAVVVTAVEVLKRAETSSDDGFDQMMTMIYIVAGLIVVWTVLRLYQRRRQQAHYARMENLRRSRRPHDSDDSQDTA